MHKTNLLLDTLIFLAFLIIMEPLLTGIPLHEWLALALAATIVVHLLLHWQWIISVGKTFFRKVFHRSRLKFIVDGLLFTAFTIAMMTGLLISRSVLPALGIAANRNIVWRQLHDLSANLTLVLVGLHFALNWDWVKEMTKRYVISPIFRRNRTANVRPQPSSSDIPAQH